MFSPRRHHELRWRAKAPPAALPMPAAGCTRAHIARLMRLACEDDRRGTRANFFRFSDPMVSVSL